MSEDSTAPDLVGLVCRKCQATAGHEVGAAIAFCAPDAAWQMQGPGTTVAGADAIRGVAEEPIGSCEDFGIDSRESLDPGKRVGLRVSVHVGRPAGSTGGCRYRLVRVSRCSDGKIVRLASYPDVREAPVAAIRLARERR
jgi:hypothetical protein